MADIPGLIQGASSGKGLGLKFLKHIERNKILLFLIDGSDSNPKTTFQLLKDELKSYNPALLMKPIILIKTKNDISNDLSDQSWSEIPEYAFGISSVTNSNIKRTI